MAMSKRCIPYTPRSRELKETVFALVTTAGVHLRDQEAFDLRFNEGVSSEVKTVASRPDTGIDPGQVSAIAEAVRQLDQLRADGLISEYEFEQKRRQLLDRILPV